VKIRDVKIPASLEDAMSRKAQDAREKEARIILSESEAEVARQMKAASEVYESDPTSLQLRMMNMTYESVKEKGALGFESLRSIFSFNSFPDLKKRQLL
jgi:regulator of protease activity HflC (stomatin/prohibitin superfamily)